MAARKPKKAKTKFRNIFFDGMWADALWSFVLNLRLWSPTAFIFLLIWIPVSYFFQDYNHLFAPHGQDSGLFNSYADTQFLQLLDTVVFLLLYWVQTYFFLILFLSQNAAPKPLKPTLDNFVHASGQASLMVSIVGINLIFNVQVWRFIIEFGASLFHDPDTVKTANIILAAAAVISIGLTSAYLVSRFFLMIPLAIMNTESPFKFAWTLTKEKFFRILINVLILEIIINPPFWMIRTFLHSVSEQPVKTAMTKLSLSMLYSLYVVFEGGALASFICIAQRKFYQEHIVSKIGTDRRAVSRS